MARRRAGAFAGMGIGTLIAVGAGLWFLFGRKAEAAPTTKLPPGSILAAAGVGLDPEGKAEAEAAAAELWYSGVLNDFGTVVKNVPGVTQDPDTGEPIPLHGENMESYQERALAYQDLTGQMMPLPF